LQGVLTSRFCCPPRDALILLSLAPGVPVSAFVTTISFAIFLVCWAIGGRRVTRR
jgi:hypothetical protein